MYTFLHNREIERVFIFVIEYYTRVLVSTELACALKCCIYKESNLQVSQESSSCINSNTPPCK